jgi:hypothetical protein
MEFSTNEVLGANSGCSKKRLSSSHYQCILAGPANKAGCQSAGLRCFEAATDLIQPTKGWLFPDADYGAPHAIEELSHWRHD